MHTTEHGGSTTRRGKPGGETVFTRHTLNLALDEKWQEETRRQKKLSKKCRQAAGETRKNKSQAIHQDYTSPTWELSKWVTV